MKLNEKKSWITRITIPNSYIIFKKETNHYRYDTLYIVILPRIANTWTYKYIII